MTELTNRAADQIGRAFPLAADAESRFDVLDLSFGSASQGVPDGLVESLPAFVANAAALIEHASEKDVFIVAAVGVSSGTLPQLTGSYRHRNYSPNVFTAIFGEPGAGKGMVGTAGHLLLTLNDRLRTEGASASGGDPLGRRPPCLLLPGNSSSAALYAQLEANGGEGILLETEIDALLSALRNDWGDLSHVLRQAYENETVSLSRVKHPEPIVIRDPRMSCILGGTAGQLIRLLPSSEDGLLSRFSFHWAPHDPTWRSGRPTGTTAAFNEAVKVGADTVDRVYAALASRDGPLAFEVGSDEWDLHDEVFEHVKGWGHQVQAPSAFDALVHRAGAIAFRVAMGTSAYRAHERGEDLVALDRLRAQPSDLEAGILFALHGLDHGARFLSVLPQTPTLLSPKEDVKSSIFDALDQTFHRSEVARLAKDMGYKDRSVAYFLKEWRSDRMIFSIGKGEYQKLTPDPAGRSGPSVPRYRFSGVGPPGAY